MPREKDPEKEKKLDEAAKKFERTLGSNRPVKDDKKKG